MIDTLREIAQDYKSLSVEAFHDAYGTHGLSIILEQIADRLEAEAQCKERGAK